MNPLDFFDSIQNRMDTANFDFVGMRRRFAALSGVLVLASWLAFIFVGPNWGIDFTGGTEIQVRFDDAIEISEVRDALETLGIPSDAIQEVGAADEYEFKIRIKDATFGSDALKTDVIERLQTTMGQDWVADWSKDVTFSAEVGARFSVRYQGARTMPPQVAPALEDIAGASVEEGREENEIVIKLPGLSDQIQEEIASAMQGRSFVVESVNAVGPKVGESLRRQGFSSLAATLGLVLVYVAFRFDIAFAPGAILALIHDVSLTVGVFVVAGIEFNLPIVGALLTIVGYSLNDTIVIYDRIRENQARYRREDLAGLINGSINETLTRTIATSLTTFLAISAFLFLGSSVIHDFVLAMMCGIVFGTYSTVFVASPMILGMDRLKPWLSSLIAIDTGDAEEGAEEEIPDQFLSESEKRRRERAENAAQGDDQV